MAVLEQQLGVKVPATLKKEVKRESVNRDIPMKEIVADALKLWLQAQKKKGE